MALNTHYTFGDVDLAADRLAELARVFEPSLLDFLRRAGVAGARVVLDLGCGPGYTTRSLARALSPDRLVGIDGSERFLSRARAESPATIEYRQADVTTYDFATIDADIIYSRFLLTHLPDPSGALSRWAGALGSGGRILLQEVADLSSPHPVLARYYELVAELQRRHGQSLHIGRELPTLVDRDRYRLVSFEPTPIHVTAAQMARLHAMNIQTWRHDDGARDFEQAEVDRLQAGLEDLAAQPDSVARVDYTMGGMVLEKR